MKPTKNVVAILIIAMAITMANAAPVTKVNDDILSKRGGQNGNCSGPPDGRPNDCNDKKGKHSPTS